MLPQPITETLTAFSRHTHSYGPEVRVVLRVDNSTDRSLPSLRAAQLHHLHTFVLSDIVNC